MRGPARMADRRTIIGAGALLAGAGAVPALAEAQQGAASGGGPAYTPQFEPQDAWLDDSAKRHRMVLDTTSADAAASALFYADNFYTANHSAYGIAPQALGVAIVLRHMSTPFGFNDAMWKKYGALIAAQLKLEGARAIAATTGNPLLSAAKDDKDAVTIAALAAKGARFAVCGMATHGLAMGLAKKTGAKAEDVEKELRANLAPGALMVAAGVVAINRAQEHGYAFMYVAE
ncbi:hypothetical protein [Hephaestia mangrovi]|uniref:hypothetical protein n=1 Tax=Hephaestia mangrovi TaxID=2873268 RepID=UPI001CA698E2|nr:hypothetical protein [Hephaestia mangrovi]MBY8826812.1 hypothetical protein [Hephaestia mangrovi]